MEKSNNEPIMLTFPALRSPGGPAALPPVSLEHLDLDMLMQQPSSTAGETFRSGHTSRSGDKPAWRLVLATENSRGPAPREIEAALAPLSRHREALPPLIYDSWRGYDPDEAVARWAEVHADALEGTACLLVAGDSCDLPFGLARSLNATRPTGRLSFNCLDQYASYAEKVVRAETRGPEAGSRPWLGGANRGKRPGGRRSFISFATDNDEPTALTDRQLVNPMLRRLHERWQDLTIRSLSGHGATGRELLDVLQRDEPRPSLLLAACHGVELDEPSGPTQGAPCDQRGELLWPFDLPKQDVPLLEDGIAILCCCSSGGTPARRTWAKALPGLHLPAPAYDRACEFTSSLLAGARGPLAILAYEDLRASYIWPTEKGSSEPDDSLALRPLALTLDSLLDGASAGTAYQRLGRASADFEASFRRQLRKLERTNWDRERPDSALLISWLRWMDARGWVLLGDPLVSPEGGRGRLELVDVYRG